MTGITPSQTVGPFFAYGLTPNGQYAWADTFTNDLTVAGSAGETIRIIGRVFDGDGAPVPDAMLEIWQADAQGRYQTPQGDNALQNAAFTGFGRCGADADGGFSFTTIKPGIVPDPDNTPQAPHILLAIFARGMLLHNYTRIYFSDESARNAHDPVLAQVPDARRATLIATREDAADGVAYRFDIRLQGDNETVFFAV
jgi:protocatechuate 3,4-dioxygenase alpha subunit